WSWLSTLRFNPGPPATTPGLLRSVPGAALESEKISPSAGDPVTIRGDLAGRPSWPRRVAAALALLAPIAMVAVAVVALAGDLAIAVLAVALVLAANSAVWLALTERGARRAVGVVVAALAGSGLVVVLATHWQGLLVLVALLFLLALFGLAARYALG